MWDKAKQDNWSHSRQGLHLYVTDEFASVQLYFPIAVLNAYITVYLSYLRPYVDIQVCDDIRWRWLDDVPVLSCDLRHHTSILKVAVTNLHPASLISEL
jgi:hypothetical protein